MCLKEEARNSNRHGFQEGSRFFSITGPQMKAIRGAICAPENTGEAIYVATQALLGEIVQRNGLELDAIVAAFFTMTPDLDADFPAYAARDMGWADVPMLGAQETLVAGAPDRSIRVLVLTEGDGSARHVYLGRAAAMRPELAEPGDENWDITAVRGGGDLVELEARERLLVVGLGLIGGSLAAAASRSGVYASVRGYDRDSESAALALKHGLVGGTGDDLPAELAQAEIVLLAVPVSAIIDLMPLVGRFAQPGAVVTDVGSTKRRIVEAMGALPQNVRAVAGHPMAGSTASGVTAATANLFRGAKWALVATPRSDDDAFAKVERLVNAIGARAVRISADLHDRIVAITSHLPAIMAVGLIELAGDLAADLESDAFLAGPGLRSASRLAAADPSMTAQMASENADNLRGAIDGLIERLLRLREAAGGDTRELRDRLAAAGATRADLIAKSSGH